MVLACICHSKLKEFKYLCHSSGSEPIRQKSSLAWRPKRRSAGTFGTNRMPVRQPVLIHTTYFNHIPVRFLGYVLGSYGWSKNKIVGAPSPIKPYGMHIIIIFIGFFKGFTCDPHNICNSVCSAQKICSYVGVSLSKTFCQGVLDTGRGKCL